MPELPTPPNSTTPAVVATTEPAAKPQALKESYSHSDNIFGQIFRKLFDAPSKSAILSGAYFEHLLMRPDKRYDALDKFLMDVTDYTGETRQTLLKNMGEVLKKPGNMELWARARMSMRLDEDNRRFVQDKIINEALVAAGVKVDTVTSTLSLEVSDKGVTTKSQDTSITFNDKVVAAAKGAATPVAVAVNNNAVTTNAPAGFAAKIAAEQAPGNKAVSVSK